MKWEKGKQKAEELLRFLSVLQPFLLSVDGFLGF